MKPFAIKRVTASDVRPLRHEVLWPHRNSPAACTIPEDEAADTRHLAAFNARGVIVGVCSLFDQRSERFPEAIPRDDAVYRLRVMGTLPAVRGQGAGAALIAEVCATAKGLGADWVWCDAREVAWGFYERLGFAFVSGVYEVPKIGLHRMMAKRL